MALQETHHKVGFIPSVANWAKGVTYNMNDRMKLVFILQLCCYCTSKPLKALTNTIGL